MHQVKEVYFRRYFLLTGDADMIWEEFLCPFRQTKYLNSSSQYFLGQAASLMAAQFQNAPNAAGKGCLNVN
jgi:hypothetical protein